MAGLGAKLGRAPGRGPDHGLNRRTAAVGSFMSGATGVYATLGYGSSGHGARDGTAQLVLLGEGRPSCHSGTLT